MRIPRRPWHEDKIGNVCKGIQMEYICPLLSLPPPRLPRAPSRHTGSTETRCYTGGGGGGAGGEWRAGGGAVIRALSWCFLVDPDPDWQKTEAQKLREKLLLEELVTIVNKRDELVIHLDNQERAIDEDEQIEHDVSRASIKPQEKCALM
ncbi:uncharacterized protein [Penaeus vannamei]|uniref:uncharacterized protein n=1 Tax=Penaeus vannamei TaxID=6689 RepID=UPI00387F44FA